MLEAPAGGDERIKMPEDRKPLWDRPAMASIVVLGVVAGVVSAVVALRPPIQSSGPTSQVPSTASSAPSGTSTMPGGTSSTPGQPSADGSNVNPQYLTQMTW